MVKVLARLLITISLFLVGNGRKFATQHIHDSALMASDLRDRFWNFQGNAWVYPCGKSPVRVCHPRELAGVLTSPRPLLLLRGRA